MYCDGHQNCGFLTNKDEWGCRLGRDAAWSFGTITVLVTIWVAIVTILMLATVFLLQWNRITFRTPLDMLAETRGGGAAAAANITTTSDRREAGHVMSSTTAADPRTGGMVSGGLPVCLRICFLLIDFFAANFAKQVFRIELLCLLLMTIPVYPIYYLLSTIYLFR